MLLMSGAVVLPLIGAALHPVLGWCIKSGTSSGRIGLTVTVALANLISAILFVIYLSPEGDWGLSGKDWWAIGNGVIFFLGQWFSIQSVKSGDLAVHSSALGLKVVIVGAFSLMVGLEDGSWGLVLGVVLATLAVFLVSGGSAEGWRLHRKTVGLTILACLFFGLNDFMTGWQSREIGAARWLTLMMSTSGLISFVLLLTRREQLCRVFREPSVGKFVLIAGFLLGLQALVVNLAFSQYGQPTLSNVVYSARGVMAVIFLYLIGQRMRAELMKKQIAGSALMIAALALVLW